MDNPTSVDTTASCGAVSFQGDEGTCAQNAYYNLLLYETNLTGSPFKIDRQIAYQSVLDDYNLPTRDIGTTLAEIRSMGITHGFTSDTGIYGPQYIGTQPTAAQVADALTHTVTSTTAISTATQASTLGAEIADMLNHDQQVILSFNVFQNFELDTGLNTGAALGGHAVAVVGINSYNDAGGSHHDMLTVASWGPQYGNGGYFKLDLSPTFNMQDLISVDTVNGFNGVNWAGDANSVNIAELYTSLLARAPETSAFANISAWMNGGASVTDVASAILASAEGQLKLPSSMTNDQFTHAMFLGIQGRAAPLAGGVAFWDGYLDGGGSRAGMVAGMLHDTQDSAQWAFNYWAGSNPILRTASDYLYNHAVAAMDLGLHMQDTGATSASAALLASVMANVTADPNSVQAALVGVPAALGHVMMV